MNKILKTIMIMVSFLTLSTSVSADNSVRDVIIAVQKFKQAVACQNDDMPDIKVVTLRPNDENGVGAVYIALWYGDIGCSGGVSTIGTNLSVLTQAGFSASITPPVVVLGLKEPEFSIIGKANIKVVDGLLYVSGLTYGQTDQPNKPTLEKTYVFRYVEGTGLVRAE